MSASAEMWPEVLAFLQGKKQGIKVTGATLSQRLEESSGEVPDDVYKALAPQATSVELSGTATTKPPLQQISASVGQLGRLIELVASGNQLTYIAKEIGNVTLLRTLMLNNNALTSLPNELGSLASLQTLHVANNKLVSLPASISKLTELNYVNAGFNVLERFPEQLCSLPKLGTLILPHNRLQNISGSIKGLQALHTLELNNNLLPELPSALGDCVKLKSLLLDDNPFTDKKLVKIIRENKVKNILAHTKKFGTAVAEVQSASTSSAATSQTPNTDFKVLPVDDNLEVYVSPGVKEVRPSIVCAVLRGVQFTPSSYERFIALQTELHQSICEKRSLAAIGTHDLTKCVLPLYYQASPPSEISFVPLRREGDAEHKEGVEVRGDELSAHFAGDGSMLRYLSNIKGLPCWAVLRDAQQRVLSLPPVINGEISKLEIGSTDILLEVTGPGSVDFCRSVAQEFLVKFSEVVREGGQELAVAPVRVLSEDGHQRHVFPRPY